MKVFKVSSVTYIISVSRCDIFVFPCSDNFALDDWSVEVGAYLAKHTTIKVGKIPSIASLESIDEKPIFIYFANIAFDD